MIKWNNGFNYLLTLSEFRHTRRETIKLYIILCISDPNRMILSLNLYMLWIMQCTGKGNLWNYSIHSLGIIRKQILFAVEEQWYKFTFDMLEMWYNEGNVKIYVSLLSRLIVIIFWSKESDLFYTQCWHILCLHISVYFLLRVGSSACTNRDVKKRKKKSSAKCTKSTSWNLHADFLELNNTHLLLLHQEQRINQIKKQLNFIA